MGAGAFAPAHAQVALTPIYSFSGDIDGGVVYAPLLAGAFDASGAPTALYGTTGYGGGAPATCTGRGCGTVFQLTPPTGASGAWTKTVLASFSRGGTGDLPVAGLLADGATASGPRSLLGATSGLKGGNGTLFRLTNGILTTIWNFTGGRDGSSPVAGLIAGRIAGETGVLYGTAQLDGAHECGTVFKTGKTKGTLKTIWRFSGGGDGCNPASPLIENDRGVLFGTTYAGGDFGKGVVFSLLPPRNGSTAWTERTLWSFTGGSDGANPTFAGVVAGQGGAIFGITYAGGAADLGVVFKLTPPAIGQTAWTEQTLWSFTGGSDGSFPVGGLVADRTGALYGTTNGGGTGGPACFVGGNGVVFKLAPVAGQATWSNTTLWSFSGRRDGCRPVAALIADQRGDLYGTTQYGGLPGSAFCARRRGCGVAFRLTGTGFAP